MNDSNSPVVLLLTATIDPGSTPVVARGDPQTRLCDYEQALAAWLRSGAIDKVVFCENSGYDLSRLESLAASNGRCSVEFLSFSGNERGAERGKGFSELVGMEYALANSKLLAGCRLVVKCTGRLTVSNAVALLALIRPLTFDVMCDLRWRLSYADSRIFAVTPAFISNYLLPKRDLIDDLDGVFLEHALACASAHAVADRKIWRPLPIYPRIRGISGSHGHVMTDGSVKWMAKSAYHRFRNFVYEK
jgi:hypothetical protein